MKFEKASVCQCCLLLMSNGECCANDNCEPANYEDPGHNWNPGTEEYGFSWASCDRCGSPLGGDRYEAFYEVED